MFVHCQMCDRCSIMIPMTIYLNVLTTDNQITRAKFLTEIR